MISFRFLFFTNNFWKEKKNEQKYELVKFVDNELELEVNVSPKEETIWMSLDQITLLFERDKSVISKHIKNIFFEKELINDQVVAKNATTAADGKVYKVTYYNLDVIISVGYRVKSKRGVMFRKWANQVLKDYLLKGYAINENRVIVSNENYIELTNQVLQINNKIYNIETDMNNRLVKLEDKVFDKTYGVNKLFFDGQFYDAYTLIQSLFESASNEIIIIDNYTDRTILDRLTSKKQNVNVIIYTDKSKSKITINDINFFNNQYSNLSIRYTKKVHDRYVILDQTKLYHLGHSIKDKTNKICLGMKKFSISESDSNLIPELLKNI